MEKREGKKSEGSIKRFGGTKTEIESNKTFVKYLGRFSNLAWCGKVFKF